MSGEWKENRKKSSTWSFKPETWSPEPSVNESVMSAECLWESCCVWGYMCLSKSVVTLFGYMQQQGTNEFTYLSESEAGSILTISSSVTHKAYLMCQPCRRKGAISQPYLSPKSRLASVSRTSCVSISRISYRFGSSNRVFELPVSGGVKIVATSEFPRHGC